eukprot:symbB.v1.2.007716.t3/scaffold479.1/size198797/8
MLLIPCCGTVYFSLQKQVESRPLAGETVARSGDGEGASEDPIVWEVLSQRIEAEALERTNAISRLTTFIEEAIASINQNLMDAAAQGMQTSKEETLPARSGLEDVQKMMSRLSETQTEQEDRIRGLVQKVEEVSGSQAILDRDQKAEALERTNAISRLEDVQKMMSRPARSGLEDVQKMMSRQKVEEVSGSQAILDRDQKAIASINQNLMDAAAQGMQTSKEETLPARSGLEDVQKMMSRLSETQTEQEDRIRGLVQKVEEVSGSQAILDRDQKAAFQELSTSITDMNIRLGGRTSGLVEDLKSLQEDVMEFRTTLTTLGTPPSLVGAMESHRLRQLIEQLVAEHELEIQRLKRTNEQLLEVLGSEKLEPSTGLSGQDTSVSVGIGLETRIPLREAAAHSDDLADSTFGSTFGHSSYFLPVPLQKQQVDIAIHGIQGLPLDLVPSPSSQGGQKCRCKLKIHLGSDTHETDWAELRQDACLPGTFQESWGAVWEQNSEPGPLTRRQVAWNVPDKVVVDLLIDGLKGTTFRACVHLGAERQLWAFEHGGFLDAEIKGSTVTTVHSSIPSRENSQDSLASLPDHGQAVSGRRGGSSTVSPVGPPPKCYSLTADGGDLLERLHSLFDVDEVAPKVVMPRDLVAALKLARKGGQQQMMPPPTPEELEEVLLELRRIHQKVYEKGRRLSISGSCQPVMSWKAFQDCILLEDLPNLANGRSALLGDAVPTTSATKAILLAYAKTRKPATTHDFLVHGVTALSTVSILSSFLLLGVSLDYASDWPGWLVFEAIFACIFVTEIVVKCWVFTSREYFMGSSRWWNRFDVLLTAVAVVELILNLFSVSGGQAKLVLILRGLRLARVARLAKLVNLPLLQELANIVSGFLISVRSLFWVVLTINVVVYVCALALRSLVQSFTTALFRDTCNESGDTMDMDTDDFCGRKLHLIYGEEYCGSVLRCMFSIFRCMIGDCTSAGGRSLTMIFSHGFGLRFDLLYALSMVCVLFGLFNIITAIFVEATLNGLRQNEIERKYAKAYESTYMTEQLAKLVVCISHQTQQLRTKKTSSLESPPSNRRDTSLSNFNLANFDMESDEEIILSEDEFNQVIKSPEVRQLLDELDVVVEPRPGVFEAFNTDDNGFISMTELVSGFMRLRGDLNKVDIVITQMALENLQKRQVNLAQDLNEMQTAQTKLWNALESKRLGSRSQRPRGDHAIPNAAELGRKLREVAEAPMRTLASDQPGGPYQTSSGRRHFHPRSILKNFPDIRGCRRMDRSSITTPQRPNHLSPSSSWSHLAPFQMAGTVSFPVANWNPYVHAEQQEIHRVIGHPRPERANNWQETPTRSMSGAFTSPPLSARLPPRAETTAPSTGASSTPTGTGQVIRLAVQTASQASFTALTNLKPLMKPIAWDRADLYNCSSAIVAFGKKNNWFSSLAILDRMPAERLSPNAVVYNSAVTACSSAWERVAKLLSSAEVLDRQNLIAMNSAMSTYSKTTRWQQSICAFEALRDEGLQPDSWTFVALIGTVEQRQGYWALAVHGGKS